MRPRRTRARRGRSRGQSGRPFLWAFVTSFALLGLLGVTWSLATPLNGGPDELAQTIKAAAVVRGQWVGVREPHDRSAFTTVHVPTVFADFQEADCVRGRPAVPAGTCPVPADSARMVAADTYVGHYPPLYYLLVGWPSFWASTRSIYLMRIMSVLVSTTFLALAVGVAVCWSRSRLMIAAVAVAVTPMTLFMAGVINPSGLEISGAVAMWTAAAVMVFDHPVRPPAGLIAVLAASVCVEVLVRGDSPLWPVLALLVAVPLGWRRFRLRDFLARPAFRVAAAMVSACGVAALVWLAVGRPLTVAPLGALPAGMPAGALIRVVVGSTGMLLHQMVGVFGYVDTPAPLFTYLVWAAATGSLVLIAVLLGRRGVVAAVGLALSLSTVVPYAMIAATAHQTSLFQGRYFLPLAVCVPIVAGVTGVQAGLPVRAAARWSTMVVVLVCAAQFAAGYWALHRYLVGVDGPLLPTATVPGVWHPPVPAWTLDAAFLLGWAAVATLCTVALRAGPAVHPVADRGAPAPAGVPAG